MAEPGRRAQAVAHDERRHRGGTRVGRVGMAKIGGDEGERDDHQAGDKGREAAELLTEHRHQRAEHADQGEGAQTRARRRHTLALKADQQADSDRDQEGLDLAGIERSCVRHDGRPVSGAQASGRRLHDDTPTWAGDRTRRASTKARGLRRACADPLQSGALQVRHKPRAFQVVGGRTSRRRSFIRLPCRHPPTVRQTIPLALGLRS